MRFFVAEKLWKEADVLAELSRRALELERMLRDNAAGWSTSATDLRVAVRPEANSESPPGRGPPSFSASPPSSPSARIVEQLDHRLLVWMTAARARLGVDASTGEVVVLAAELARSNLHGPAHACGERPG